MRLKTASDGENPWLDGKRLLEEADAATMRLIDLSKRKPVWRQMIEADGEGQYRLNIDLLSPERRRIRSYREELGAKVRASFLGSDRTYGARRVWTC